MNIQFKKGVLELCVLSLTNSRDYYGYELVQAISENIDISEGSIYPLLRRLSKEGFFRTYLKESEEGPPRKYYNLTDVGIRKKEALENEWRIFLEKVDKILKREERDD